MSTSNFQCEANFQLKNKFTWVKMVNFVCKVRLSNNNSLVEE